MKKDVFKCWKSETRKWVHSALDPRNTFPSKFLKIQKQSDPAQALTLPVDLLASKPGKQEIWRL